MSRPLLSRLVLILGVFALVAGCGGGDDGGGGGNPDWTQFDGHGGGPGEDTAGPVLECGGASDCPPELPVCDTATKVCVECSKDDHCSGDTPICHPLHKECVACVMDDHCGPHEHCLDGICSDKVCWPGVSTCVGNSAHTCSEDGMDPNWKVVPCVDQYCFKGECIACNPGQTQCKGKFVVECNDSGSDYQVLQDCGDKQCIGDQCLFCYPGNKMCDGNIAMMCNQEGEAWEAYQNCDTEGLSCIEGLCISPCAGDIKQNTNAGCEFYAVDLHNAVDGSYDAQNAQFAVVTSNTSTEPATVTVTLPDGTPQTQIVPGESLHKFLLQPTWGIEGSELSAKGYKINSSRPITVYQFNPLSNDGVFSNDASVLLPAPTLGNDYYVMTYNETGTFQSNFAVVGISSNPTEVTVTVTAPTKGGGSVPAMAQGETQTFTVNQGQVLAIEASSGDLTGSHITSIAPVAVFGAHTAANMGVACCADHLEQQMTPVNTWGSHYIVTQSFPRWMEKDYVRILAAQDGTQVTLNPAVAMVPTLNAGEHFTFKFQGNVEVTATGGKPILVAQYLASSYEILNQDAYPNMDFCGSSGDCPPGYTCDFMGCTPPMCYGSDAGCPSGHSCEIDPLYGDGYCAPVGDPAMIMSVPAEQFMESYVFLVPDAYLLDYLNVIAPTTAQHVVLDGNQIPPHNFTPIGASGYGVYRTELPDGIHSIWSDQGIGIMVYGYDDDVSYGYPGGLGLIDLGI